jgi:hypothetical protein
VCYFSIICVAEIGGSHARGGRSTPFGAAPEVCESVSDFGHALHAQASARAVTDEVAAKVSKKRTRKKELSGEVDLISRNVLCK